MDVKPVFYTKKGEPIEGDHFQMQPAEVKTVDLKSLMPSQIRKRRDLGGMTLSYTGHMLEMWGQIRLMQVRDGGSVDVFFANLSDRRSSVRDAVWYMPKRSSAVIAIGNAGATSTNALVRFSNGDSQQIQIPAFGTELIRRRSEQESPKEDERSGEAVEITSADGSGNLIFAGAVVADDGRYASSIRFYDTQRAAQPNLYATRFRLKNVKPYLWLRNTATEPIDVTPRFLPAPGDDGTFIDLPGLVLQGGEIARVDLSSLRSTVHGNHSFDDVSIQILNSGRAGSLIGGLTGVDTVSGMTYDVPLRDIGALRGSTGSYPWRLDGDMSTIVSLTNVAPAASQFVVQINYPGGPYLLNPRKLAPGGTATFDLRRIRDDQIPDLNGHTIPQSVTGGQFRWFIHGAGSGRLIGRAEMLSVSRNISSSYSCNDPCPPTLSSVWLDPDSLTFATAEEGGQTAWEMDYDGYGNYIGPFSPWVASWSVSDSSVVSMEDYGTYADFTGLAEGFVSTGARINYEQYVWDGLECLDEGQNQTDASGDLNVQDVTFIGASDGFSSAPFILNVATLPVACGGERFVLHVTFKGPTDTTGLCNGGGPSPCFVTLSSDNKFEFAASPIHPNINYEFHPDGSPRPYVDIGLRRRGDGGGTTNNVSISVSGTRQLGSGTFSGSGVVHMGCS